MRSHKLAALTLAFFTTALTTPAHAEWLEAKSKHFTVYGDMPEADLRQRTQRLERFDAALRGLFKVTTDDNATIYFVASLEEIRKLARMENVAGFYRADAQGAVGIVPERLPDYMRISPDRVLYHEYTHHMLLSNTTQFFPGWVTEGLAELFMSAKFDEKGNVIIGEPNANRSWAMGSLSRWSVRRLLDSDANPPKIDDRIELYSRGWLMCHYLLIGNKRPGQFFKFIDAINAGMPPLQAGEQVFGNLEKLDQEIERYVRANKFPSSLLSAEKLSATTDVSVRRFTPGETAIFKYRLVSANGVDEKSAVTLANTARRAATGFPDDTFVQRTMAEIEYDAKGYDAADVHASRALAIDPKNIMAMVYKGRVAVQRAMISKNPAQWREARRWFLAANRLDPNYALPFALYHDSFVAAGQEPPADAIAGISRAVVLVPADSSLRVRAGIALIRAGDLKLARTVLAPVAFNPHEAGKNPYAKLVKEMDAGATREALLTKAAELKIDKVNEFIPPVAEGKPGDGKTDGGKDKKFRGHKTRSSGDTILNSRPSSSGEGLGWGLYTGSNVAREDRPRPAAARRQNRQVSLPLP